MDLGPMASFPSNRNMAPLPVRYYRMMEVKGRFKRDEKGLGFLSLSLSLSLLQARKDVR